MIDPPPDAIIAGTPYLHPNATPLTLMPSVVSQMDTSVSVTEPSWLIITPALLYRTCRPPKRSRAALTIASASASSETSAWTYCARPPVASISAATASPASSATSVRTIAAPSLANSFEATIPMPLPPPVMSATLPSSRPIVPSPFHASRRAYAPLGGPRRAVVPRLSSSHRHDRGGTPHDDRTAGARWRTDGPGRRGDLRRDRARDRRADGAGVGRGRRGREARGRHRASGVRGGGMA